MREILFRGQCCTDGKWVEGYLGIEVPDELVIQQFSFDEYFKSNCIDQYSVKPETVGQYTGLKDLHGTKIFEGDVVKSIAAWYVVEFENGGYGLRPFGKGKLIPIMGHGNFNENEVEVIGNIHDNPELLDEEQK